MSLLMKLPNCVTAPVAPYDVVEALDVPLKLACIACSPQSACPSSCGCARRRRPRTWAKALAVTRGMKGQDVTGQGMRLAATSALRSVNAFWIAWLWMV